MVPCGASAINSNARSGAVGRAVKGVFDIFDLDLSFPGDGVAARGVQVESAMLTVTDHEQPTPKERTMSSKNVPSQDCQSCGGSGWVIESAFDIDTGCIDAQDVPCNTCGCEEELALSRRLHAWAATGTVEAERDDQHLRVRYVSQHRECA